MEDVPISKETEKPSYSKAPSIESILARDKSSQSQPSDDDYVLNLIETIEIPTQDKKPKVRWQIIQIFNPFCKRSHIVFWTYLWRSYKLTSVRPLVRLSVTSFSRDWLISFFWFLNKDAKWQCPKCDGARFLRKIFSRPKMPEICRKPLFFCRFCLDFFFLSRWIFT